MEWELRNGEQAQKVIARCQDTGQPVPPHILDRPYPLETWIWAWNAFHKLSSCRQIGMGFGGIPITAVYQYEERNGFDPEECYELECLLCAMDEKFLEIKAEEVKSK